MSDTDPLAKFERYAAEKILDRPFADPDDDAAIVARAAIRLAASDTALAPHPGENHDYRMTCLRCGEPGYLFVGFHAPGETWTVNPAPPPGCSICGRTEAHEAADHTYTPGVTADQLAEEQE